MSGRDRYEELMSSMLDGELSEEEQRELEAHLEASPESRREYEALGAVSSALRESAPELPAGLHDSIMDGVRNAAGEKNARPRRLRRLRPVIAAAACFAVIAVGLLASGVFSGSGRSTETTAAVTEDEAELAVTEESAEATEESTEESAIEESSALTASGRDSETEKSAVEDGEQDVPEDASVSESEPVELDMASARLTVYSGDVTSEELLDSTDSRVWLVTLIESGGENFAAGATLQDISYEFNVTRESGDGYTVYFFYNDEDALCASLNEDRSDSAVIASLEDYAALVVDAGEE